MPSIAEINAAAKAGQLDNLATRVATMVRDRTHQADILAHARSADDRSLACLRALSAEDHTAEEIAALVLAGIDSEAIAAAIPAGLAQEVADELAKRLDG